LILFWFLVIRKRFEKFSAGNRSEFEEHYGFLIENDNQVSDICTNGYHCTETSFNVLGKYIFQIVLLIHLTYWGKKTDLVQ
jgi:hypothetical protein